MEGVSATMYKGLRGYWKRKNYERLSKSGRRRKNNNQVELGRSGRRRRRFWRIKISPKLRFFSPKKFLIGLRDAYVNFMIRIANKGVMSSGFGGVVDNSIAGFGRGPVKEYDEKMIIEIYKSLVMAQAQFVPRDAGRLGSQIRLPTMKVE
ncbi:hypothetical protein ACSBR1_021879 [Camellia fascicularis]